MEKFNTFIKKILLGDLSIHDPILVRITNSTSEELPFMEYLMKYKNINNNNLLESLNSITNLFRRKFHSLHNNNNNIKELFDNVKSEWFLEEEDVLDVFKSSLTENFFGDYEKCKLEYNKACNLCDELIEVDQKESNIPIESILRNELPINRKASGMLFLCNDIYKFIDQFRKILEKILDEYKTLKHSLLIDLSTRLKSSYNCNNIPNNIHTIFMNYIIINNFIYKELTKIHHQTIGYLNKIMENCENMKGISENHNELANINFMDYLTSNDNDNDNYDNDNDEYDYYDPNVIMGEYGNDNDNDNDDDDNDDDDDDDYGEFTFY